MRADRAREHGAEGAQPKRQRRRLRRGWRERLLRPWVWVTLVLASLAGAVVWLGSGCGGWDPSEPLMRNAPEVDEAIRLMDAGDYSGAAALLEAYLGTDACKDGELVVPPSARKKADGTFDLGLVLFHLAEQYGARFGDEEKLSDAAQEPPEIDERRTSHIDCALDVVKVIAGDASIPGELRARAHYLAGNLEFLRREYEKAVEHYDLALQLVPGIGEDADGDPLGRDAAWNRAIALRRQMEQDAGAPDAEPDAEPDGGDEGDQGDGGGQDPDSPPEPQNGDDEQDAGTDPKDAEPDAGGGDDEQRAEQPEPSDAEPNEGDTDDEPQQGSIAEAGEPEQDGSRMRSILERLEDAPTYQQEEAKRMRGQRRRRVLEDK